MVEVIPTFIHAFIISLLIGLIIYSRLDTQKKEMETLDSLRSCSGIVSKHWNKTYYGEFGNYHTQCGYSTRCDVSCKYLADSCRTEPYCFKIKRTNSRTIQESFCDREPDTEYCRGYNKAKEDIRNG